MNDFIGKVEKLFASQRVRFEDFQKLIGEWGELLSNICYNYDKRQTFLKLNRIKLSVKWYKQQHTSDKSKQLQDFLEYLIQYLSMELESLEIHPYANDEATDIKGTPGKEIRWTINKRSLIELICALHEVGCINKGTITLQKLIEHFGAKFGVDLKNYHPELHKMALRKPKNDNNQRAYFLNTLAYKFNEKMLSLE
ncbi:RteC domain-containing protein [Carboxylicivirga sp. N1Y90]|uniref:RteC domain-containing protein n=1 Tax=Carboxylicivirga fragile TaxID=3417571 RepID=UPI003D3387D9|nr:RteC domain-containing protein [Marinilabiliaceae bacterium N1Y90]